MQPGSGPGLSYSSWDPYGAIKKKRLKAQKGPRESHGWTTTPLNTPVNFSVA